MSDPSQFDSPSAPSRRQFLKTAGAMGAGLSAAGPAFAHLKLSERVYTAEQPLPASAIEDPIRMAVIGPGGMGGAHCHAFINLTKKERENVEIVALAEVCKPRLDNALQVCSEKQPGVEVKGYRDYREMLKREDIQAVLVASPEHWHWKHSIDAIEAGKDVYSEKPMTLRLDEALAIRKVVLDHPERIFTVGTQAIMQPKFTAAKDLIAEKAIGVPVFSQTSYCRNSRNGEWHYGIDERVKPGEMLDWKAWCGPLPEIPFDTKVYHQWRRYKGWSTGIVGDLLVHRISPLMYAMDLGWPTRVTSSGSHFVDMAMENHDQVNMTVEFEDNHHMIVAGSTCNELGLEDIIRGHEGNLYLGSVNCVLRPERIFADEIDEQIVRCEPVHDHDEFRLHWLRCIRTREQPRSTVDLATKVMVAVDLATRSMWEGRAFAFDPDKMKVVAI